MGFLGSLFGSKVDVEGSIAVQNRPTETFFALTVLFFPCQPRAGALATGMPGEALLASALEATPSEPGGRLADIGERFSTRLAPGHYQVCVLALPLVLETSTETGRPRLVADPNNRFSFWPLPTATEVREGQRRMLSLKLDFPRGLGKFGERAVTAPLLERIGPPNRAAYARAVELAQGGDLGGAFKAYGQALVAPDLERLVPADANELRLVLTLGQYKCVMEAGRREQADQLRQHITATLIPRVRLSEADPATTWDVMSTFAIATAREGRVDLTVEYLPVALSVIVPQLSQGQAGAGTLARGALSSCFGELGRAAQWPAVRQLAGAVLGALGPVEGHAVTAVPRAYLLEALLVTEPPAARRLVAELGPGERMALIREAEQEALARVQRALSAPGPGDARA